jgi:hypothetical protein
MEAQMGEMCKLVYKRHVGRFLVLPVGGIWFNLQGLQFFPTYCVASSYACCANFDFSNRLLLCSLIHTSKAKVISLMQLVTIISDTEHIHACVPLHLMVISKAGGT